MSSVRLGTETVNLIRGGKRWRPARAVVCGLNLGTLALAAHVWRVEPRGARGASAAAAPPPGVVWGVLSSHLVLLSLPQLLTGRQHLWAPEGPTLLALQHSYCIKVTANLSQLLVDSNREGLDELC